MKKQQVRHSLTRLGELAAHPAAFGIIAVYAVAWLIFSPATFGWSAIASLAIWFMTLLITYEWPSIGRLELMVVDKKAPLNRGALWHI
jgi:hypothetical protein